MEENSKILVLTANKKRFAIYTLALAFFPLVAWMIAIARSGRFVGLTSIADAHREIPILWIIDAVPFVFAAGAILFIYAHKKKIVDLEDELTQKEDIISKNAIFAKQIGEGNFNIEIESNEADVLAKSLVLMRDNLLKNTNKEAEEAWIAEGKEAISNILRIHNKLDTLAYEVLVSLVKYSKVVQGSFYFYDEERNVIVNLASYAYNRRKYVNQEFRMGQGLIGQCAYEKDIIYRTEIPDDYFTITSGILGEQKPQSLIIIPLISDEKLYGILEFASINEIAPLTIRFFKDLAEIIARTIFNISVNERTERLLRESQQMTEELRENEEELRQNAEEMMATQEELEKTNTRLESQITEVENVQKKLHSLLENASEVISIYNKDLSLTYISPSVTSILGFTPEEMIEGMDKQRLTKKGEESLDELFQNLLYNPDQSYTIQYTFMKKNGDKIYLEVTGRNLISDPAISGIILNMQDITERKRAEKEERMKSKMQALSENSIDLIMRLSTMGQVFYINPTVRSYFDIDVKDIQNQTITASSLPEPLVEFLMKCIATISETKQKVEDEISFESNYGKTIMHMVAIPEFNDNELETILFVSHDITESKRIEMEIQEKNRNITESINYAQRIQSSILPDNRMLRKYLPNSFMFYLPRDVVSGDFPWMFVKDHSSIYVAAVDCTGHGVPGALLSFIGYFILNNTVDKDRSLNAGEVLDLLHNEVRTTLKQDRVDADARDGMDIALCKINLKENVLEFAGAHRPLYLLRNNELQEFKGERRAIGGIPSMKKAEQPFTNHTISLEEGDKIFIFSDGLPDQVGGPDGKKYSAARIRQHITTNPDLSMGEYEELFNNDFVSYKGANKQIDDILLIGIEF
jgi:PAS domain S-box-containing protein